METKTATMTCEEFWLRALADGALPGDPDLSAHLQRCADCQAEMRVMDALMETSAEPNPFHLQALSRRIEAQKDRQRSGAARLVLAATAAALAVLALLAGVWTAGGPSFPAPRPSDEAVAARASGESAPGQLLGAHSPAASARAEHEPSRAQAQGRPMGAAMLGQVRPGSLRGTAQFFALDEGFKAANGSLAQSLAQFEGFFDLGG